MELKEVAACDQMSRLLLVACIICDIFLAVTIVFHQWLVSGIIFIITLTLSVLWAVIMTKRKIALESAKSDKL